MNSEMISKLTSVFLLSVAKEANVSRKYLEFLAKESVSAES